MKEALKNIQQILKTTGLYVGAIDGIFGGGSISAFNQLIPAPVITSSALQKIFPNSNPKYLSYINEMAKDWGVITKAQMCLFLANLLVESNGFNDTDLRENFNYRPEILYSTFKKYIASVDDALKLITKGHEAIANHVYGGRLGNTENNDGWAFRGGGLIQTTGRYNYSVLGKAIKEDLINFPELISRPDIATKSAYYFWKSKNCGYYADRFKIIECRKSINGGTNGLDEVNKYFMKAWTYLI